MDSSRPSREGKSILLAPDATWFFKAKLVFDRKYTGSLWQIVVNYPLGNTKPDIVGSVVGLEPAAKVA